MPKGLYGNMKRHIRSKHSNIYEMEMQQLHGQSDDDGKDVENESTTEEEEEVLEEEILEQEVLEQDEEFLEEHIEGEIEMNSKNDTEGAQSPIPEETAYQDVDNLDTDSETNDFGEIGHLSISDPNLKNKIKWLSQRVVQGKRKIKTCVWNFFIPVVENQLYTCIFCHRDISIFPQNSSNLKRHLVVKHTEQFNLIKKYAPEYNQENKGGTLSTLLDPPKKRKDTREYHLIPTRRAKGKHLVMYKDYTFSQHLTSCYYYCSKKIYGCRARLKLGPSGNIVLTRLDHNHEPPKYVKTSKGEYIKL
ncbi:unnamed protein product [Parnassius mnemosyne]|uniref:BED-type domain-containing protein n=1 Tax=Parnassius mnemosyne TaxID=213953 RepID=A0AAV1K985_9NEOP